MQKTIDKTEKMQIKNKKDDKKLNMEKVQNNIKNVKQNRVELIAFCVIVALLSLLMIFFMSKKEGFHEDEMYTYGSSNYVYDSLFQIHGKQDTTNKLIRPDIPVEGHLGEILSNVAKYIKEYYQNPEQFWKEYGNIAEQEQPIWRTKQEAKEYITVSPNERFSYLSVYYNQARDVHPPLYCLLNHTICSFFPDTFSKYFFFSISLAFFVGTCFMIRNIFKLLGKSNLSIIAVIFYGLSMGAISTVIYARMYMMLAFFTIYYLYITLKIYKNDFKMTRRMKIELGIATVLGFLSHYYFCIFALGCFAVMGIAMLKNKKKKEFVTYLLSHIVYALIGILLYPISIYQIFFSYRGIGGGNLADNYLTSLITFVTLLFKAYSLPIILGFVLLGVGAIWFIYKFIKSKQKTYLLLITVPVILSILIIAKISPYKELRYLYGVLPVLSIAIILGLANLIEKFVKNKKIYIACISIIVAIVSIYGLCMKKPENMYIGYSKHIEIAEQHKDDNFVYIQEGFFNHIQSMQEFMIYNKTLILQETQLDYLKNNKELENSNKFILSIKKYINGRDEILQKVLENTGYKYYEFLFDNQGETNSMLYEFSK